MAGAEPRPYDYELVPTNLNRSVAENEVSETADNVVRNSIRSNSNRSRPNSAKMETGSYINQIFAACAGNLGGMSAGMTLTWTSPAIPLLTNSSTSPLDHALTDKETSWIASILPLGATLGPILAGYISDKIGRKTTMVAAGIPFIIGWILLITTTTFAQILVARFLMGLSVGAVFTVTPMYVGEIAANSIRGALGSFLQLFTTFGILYSYVVGPYVSFKQLSYASIVWPIIYVVLFFFCPESPYYLLSKNRVEDATKALMRLRGKSEAGVQEELNELKKSVEETLSQSGTIKDVFSSPGKRKAILISISLVVFQQLSGINAVLFFAQVIFTAAGGGLSPAVSSIIVGVVQVVSSGITPLVVDRLGRKMLLLISGIGMFIGEFALGLYFNIKRSHDADALSWLPVTALIVYTIVYCIGFGPLPWAVMGEIFPANIKSIASTITACSCWFLGFLITQYFSAISNAIGMDYSFWLFSGMCVLASIFVWFVVPETKGKSLQEIQDILEGYANTK